MVKISYKKELSLTGPLQRDFNGNKKDILRIQSWLALYEMSHPGAGTITGIDGDFGPATEQAVKNFQKINNLSATGKVDQSLFDRLAAPLARAFETEIQAAGLRERVVETANLHVDQHPFELVINNQANSGPWVRSYMDGFEGETWYWCMGFVQTIIDQAISPLGKKMKTLMPPTYSCDTVGSFALTQKNLTRFSALRSNPRLAKPGDIFLIQKAPFDWTHTGIVVKVGSETLETIEGNTNMEGSRNGNAVLRRVRNFMRSKIDIVSLDPLL